MANEEQLALLKASVEGWNEWREQEPDREVDLIEAGLSRTNLREANFSKANLSGAWLVEADLSKTDLSEANLSSATLFRANLTESNLRRVGLGAAILREANLNRADLRGSNLSGATFHRAYLSGADLTGANLSGANLWQATLQEANLSGANLYKANLAESSLRGAYLSGANLTGAQLFGAALQEAYLSGVDLSGARLSLANLHKAVLSKAVLREADLGLAVLREADLKGADLSGAELRGANLYKANLAEVSLRGANLTGATLINSNLVGANIDSAIISNSKVCGVSFWDLKGEFKEQKDLEIAPWGQPSLITVDNIKVAQFIYLILNNKEIRDVINTLTSKTVLILGRFAISGRKKILDALRDRLREYGLFPIVFEFERPTDQDFTETITTLASISYFVIADVTNPKLFPLDLQATIPDYQIPFVPIIQEGEKPFAMMVDLQKKYNWVLDTISYDSLDTLIEILKPHIIDPAIKKRDELRLIKAKEPIIISGRELKDKGKP